MASQDDKYATANVKREPTTSTAEVSSQAVGLIVEMMYLWYWFRIKQDANHKMVVTTLTQAAFYWCITNNNLIVITGYLVSRAEQVFVSDVLSSTPGVRYC